jgi:hypothetical protein
MGFKKTDILPAAELLERTADAFESERVEWIKGGFGWLPLASELTPQACLIGGLAIEAGIWYDTVGLKPAMVVGAPKLGSLEADELRQFALARKAAAEVIKNRADSVRGHKTHVIRVSAWNDDEETSLGDVVDVLKHAAKDLRNKAAAA